MKKIIQLTALLPLASLVTGCASPYMQDRGRDVADICTATIDTGLGASVRCGPLHAGLYAGQTKAGIKGGTLIKDKGMVAKKIDPFIIGFPWIEWRDGWCFYYDRLYVRYPNTHPAGLRGKAYAVDARLPFLAYPHKGHYPESRYPWSYYGGFEVSAAIGGGLTLGFNPIELVDFVFGWIGVDILQDDVGLTQTRSTEEAAEHELMLEHRRHPGGPGAFRLGLYYYEHNRPDDAKRYFELYRKVQAQFSKGDKYQETLLYLSLINLEQGKIGQARSIHEEFLSIAPDIDAEPRQFWRLKSLNDAYLEKQRKKSNKSVDHISGSR